MAPQCVYEIPAINLEVNIESILSITLHVTKFSSSFFSTVNSNQSHPICSLEYDNVIQIHLSAPLHVNSSLSDLFS